MHEIIRDFETQTDHRIQVKAPQIMIMNKKKRIFHIVDFFVSADHGVKIKENKKETST